jgi:hypothetical protein
MKGQVICILCKEKYNVSVLEHKCAIKSGGVVITAIKRTCVK